VISGPSTIAALSAVVVVAFTVEAALGFGATVIAVALASSVLRLPLAEVLPSFVPVNLALSTLIAFRSRRDADLRLLGLRILPAMLLGLPLGMWAFASLPESMLRRALGVFLLVLSAPLLFLPARAPKPLSPAVSLGFLGLAGVLHGAFATGGPMVVYVLSRSPASKAVFRATLSLLWAILAVVLLLRWTWSGTLTRSTFVLSAELVPAMAVGLLLGNVVHRRVDERRFRLFVNVMLLVFGVLLLVRS
jgi:hypothetical protein